MPYFVATYTYGKQSLIEATRPTHRAFISEHMKAGAVIAAGPFTDGSQSMIILRLPTGATLADAESLLEDDPYLAAGALTDRTFREWAPALNIWD